LKKKKKKQTILIVPIWAILFGEHLTLDWKSAPEKEAKL
jgi:hypothetical protein